MDVQVDNTAADLELEPPEVVDTDAQEITDLDTPEETPEEDDELIVTIGDESPPSEEEEVQAAPQWVKDLRKSDREKSKTIRELKARLETKPAAQPVKLGAKPTMEAFDHDAEKYEPALEKWFTDKRAVEAASEAEKETQDKATKEWQGKLERLDEKKAQLKVKDYDEAEEEVKDKFSVTQQGIMVQGADNPALVVYALGKNPKKAAELAAITDPVQFAFAVAKLETQLKTGTRKRPPAPETKVKGVGGVGGSTDKHLEKLRAQAAKSGDMTEVLAYKRKLKEQKA